MISGNSQYCPKKLALDLFQEQAGVKTKQTLLSSCFRVELNPGSWSDEAQRINPCAEDKLAQEVVLSIPSGHDSVGSN